MLNEKHKVFISYHHKNDQLYKRKLSDLNESYNLFIDKSVDTGDVSENLSDEDIRQKIRDNYLQDSSVTILLLGTETKCRKHIDWELYSSMYNGKVNKQSGILVINLPSIEKGSSIQVCHENEKQLYPNWWLWKPYSTWKEYKLAHPHMPERIIDNFVCGNKISVTNWDTITYLTLPFLINLAFENRNCCNYDMRRPMMRKNFNPPNWSEFFRQNNTRSHL